MTTTPWDVDALIGQIDQVIDATDDAATWTLTRATPDDEAARWMVEVISWPVWDRDPDGQWTVPSGCPVPGTRTVWHVDSADLRCVLDATLAHVNRLTPFDTSPDSARADYRGPGGGAS